MDSEESLWRTAQLWLLPALTDGTVAVDGTCGNGGDTLFLARTLGHSGSVISFDRQGRAISRTQERLSSENLHARLIHGTHSEMETLLEKAGIHSVDAAIFNLGYLPGGDHAIVTDSVSTCSALEAILRRASTRFHLAVVAYQGHPGGREETEAVKTLLEKQFASQFSLTTKTSRNPATGPVFFGLKRLN